MSKFSFGVNDETFPPTSLPFHRVRKILSFDLPEQPASVSRWTAYTDRVTNPQEPADLVEEALYRFKPGTRSGQQVAETAMIMAGIIPPNPYQELVTLAQDLVDNDPRVEGEQ